MTRWELTQTYIVKNISISRPMEWVFLWCTTCAFFIASSHGLDENMIRFHKVCVNTEKCVHQTDEKFLSIALPLSMIKHGWKRFKFRSEKLQNLARGLAPAYLRLGGIAADFLLFNSNEIHREELAKTFNNFTMRRKDVDKIFTFAKETGVSIIFGLNLLLRDAKTNRWNSSNAEELMRYIASRGFTCGWELGNEPLQLEAIVKWTTTGKELALDFHVLRKLLNENPEFGQMIFGPDMEAPWRNEMRNVFFKEFVTDTNGVIDGVTYHQYYTNNQASVSKFYDPELLDSLITEIQKVQSLMKESGASAMKLWLGETSSAYGGGVPGVSDSYVAGFMWLDKLGVAARLGHDVVVRQTFYGGSYSLINLKTLDPFPDYWSSFLYKQLVGSRVLEVRDGLTLGRKIRVYAHCASGRSNYEAGSLVLIALNTQHSDIKLILTNKLQSLTVHQYLLTPGDNNNLTSQAIRLNGKLLEMVNDTFLPNVQPKTIIPPDGIILPPVSYGFFVIPDARVKACMHISSLELFKDFVKN